MPMRTGPENLERQLEDLQAANHELEVTSARLKRALEAATAGNQTKSHFLATMSHEMRTPLNAILGFSEILKEQIFGPIGSDRYRDYAATIHKSGAYLLNLINDILDIAKFDAGKMDLVDDTLDTGRVIGDCVHLIEPQAQKARVSLHVDAPMERYMLKADERRLRQILLNLLSNAVKFTPEGGTVSVAVLSDEEGLSIKVSDTGIGIAEADIPRAFERFGQIDSTLSRKYEGTGLGLPLAKHLAELHGGSLDLASEVGVGTVATVTFPASRVLPARVAA